MQIQEAPLPGVLLIKPRVFGDDRGHFLETWKHETYAAHGISGPFVQDNQSSSCRGTLRGLHYQIQQPQGKLVFVTRGAIYDVAVDVRRDSSEFGQSFGIELTEEDHSQLYIPPGFAHGFCVLSERADFFYKCTDYYAPQFERTLLWNDPALGIEWPLEGDPILSDKDRDGLPLDQVEVFETSPA